MPKRLAVEDVHRLALDFYDAIAEPRLLPQMVSRIIEAWGAITCLTQTRTAKHDQTEVVATNFPTAGAEIYAQYYWRVDPWAERAWRMPLLRPYRGEELIASRDFARSEVYNDFVRPYLGHEAGGPFYLLGGVVPLDGQGAKAAISVHRPRNARSFTAEEQRLFGLLLPHFQRAMQLRQRIAHATTERNVAFRSLDALVEGMVVVTASGEAVLANRAAEAIAAAHDGFDLGARGRPVSATRNEETVKLRTLVASAAAAAGGGALRLSRPSGRAPYVVLVTHLPGRLAEDDDLGARRHDGLAILFISDPDRRPGVAPAPLRELYGLTPREAELAAALAEGRTLREAADSLGLAMESARTYLKRVFSKTGAARQSDLVGLLLRQASNRATSDPEHG